MVRTFPDRPVRGAGGEKLTQEEMRASADFFAHMDQYARSNDERETEKRLREIRSEFPNLVQFMEAVREIVSRGHEIDPSLVQIVLDWSDQADDADPTVLECFREAAEYLEYLLEKRTHGRCWRAGRVEPEERKGVEGGESGQAQRSA